MHSKDYSKLTVKKLEALVRHHNHLYFVEHNPEISDYEFDRLVETLKEKSPDSPVLKEIGSDITSESKKVEHPTEMLSLDKCYDDETFVKWYDKFEGDLIAAPKLDGLAVRIVYDKNGKLELAATRGNGRVGEDITENVQYINDIPKKSSALKNLELRGEIFMKLSIFKKYKDQFANPRNLAAGAVKQKDPKKTGDYNLSFMAYNILGGHFKTEEEKRIHLKEHKIPAVSFRKVIRNKVRDAYDFYLAKRDNDDFETDGVVFIANEISEQEKLGSTAHHPRFAIAYKYQGDSGITKLLDIEWSVSRTGAITPVGIVEPVELSGATVQRASLHNVGLMEKLGIKIGAKVLMMRRGGVIPNIEKIVSDKDAKPIHLPKKCPSCGSKVERKEDFLFCTNPNKCVRSKIGELKHFVDVIEIDGFGEKLIEKLYESNLVTEPFDYYSLSANDLTPFERMGPTLAQKLVRNIQDKKEIPLDVFLRSLGLREVGRHVSTILAKYGSLEKIYKLSEEELSAIDSIGPVIAKEVYKGLRDKKHLIDGLLKHIKVIPPIKHDGTGALAGKSVLFTGTLVSMGRKEAQRIVEQNGGIIASSVTKDLSFLVVGDEGKPGSKLKKAEDLQEKGSKIKIISEKEFLKLVHN